MMSAIVSGSGAEALYAASVLGSSAAVTEASVAISEFSADSMKFKVDTETTVLVGTGTRILESAAPDAISVKWKLFYAPTLADKFVEVDSGTVSVGASDSKSVDLENTAIENAKKSPNFNAGSGFFKVSVE